MRNSFITALNFSGRFNAGNFSHPNNGWLSVASQTDELYILTHRSGNFKVICYQWQRVTALYCSIQLLYGGGNLRESFGSRFSLYFWRIREKFLSKLLCLISKRFQRKVYKIKFSFLDPFRLNFNLLNSFTSRWISISNLFLLSIDRERKWNIIFNFLLYSKKKSYLTNRLFNRLDT